MIVFITTGIFFLQKTEQGVSSNIKVNIFKGLNIITILLLSYQAILLHPFEFTIYSTIFWGAHLFGLLCGIILTYQLFQKKSMG
jgi:membrane associated rhomboid family serine protease